MSEFASCYFCGTALDAQIDPYPVVPEDAGTDDRPTVDLCPVCRRKLSKVLDVALSAAENAETAATPLAAGPDPSPLEADHEDPTADLGSEDDGEEPAYAVEPSGEATAVAESEGERSESSEESSDDAEPEEDGKSTESTAAEADESDEPADAMAGDEPASAESAAETTESDDAVANGEAPGTAADDGAEGEGTDEDDTTGAEGEGTDEDDTTGADDAETAESESDKPSILSTPAAQKIIKLLQNREFPVEREEIEVVASNAYEIPQQDCDDVIEALVSEGYVGERKGKLVRPEE
ncbi:hypothetical protein ACOZ4N_19660 [Halorientalis pallida]|uniref:hypothetical protein n=1 Tax=Halorientalis pallida TaxID=2479928 RepID=UPI003C6FB54B